MKIANRLTPHALAALVVLTVLTGAAVSPLTDVAEAQQPMLWGITWNVSIPFGDTKDFVDQVSFRGIGLHARKFTDDEYSYGFTTSWNVFYEKSTDTWQQPDADGAISGTQLRDINAVPLYVNAHRYWGDEIGFRPFLGLNVGLLYSYRRLDMGMYTWNDDKWQFALAPDVGVLFPYSSFLGFAGARYNYAFKSGDFEAQQYLEMYVGFGLR